MQKFRGNTRLWDINPSEFKIKEDIIIFCNISKILVSLSQSMITKAVGDRKTGNRRDHFTKDTRTCGSCEHGSVQPQDSLLDFGDGVSLSGSGWPQCEISLPPWAETTGAVRCSLAPIPDFKCR